MMAGGTGGHVFPALAVAEELRQAGVEVAWLGTARGIEARVIPERGFPLHCISVEGIRGKGKAALLKAPFNILRACTEAASVIRAFRPDVVVGMGGFASGPGGLMGWLMRRPLLIQEQNAVAGTTNRVLAKIARVRCAAFEGTRGLGGAEVTGNPVRAMLVQKAATFRRRAEVSDPVQLLVMGGSLGALAINRIMPGVLVQLLQQGLSVTLVHQTGEKHAAQTLAAYQSKGVEARVRVVPFIEDVAEAMARADLMICRAGALTVSEAALMRLPSIFVPLPHAIDDHQTANARVMVEAGAGALMPQSDMDVDSMTNLVMDLVNTPDRLAGMQRNASRIARPEAARVVAGKVMELIR
jgi:UDP-N-acetylglucosamine--N-acetylmuramyl-(pentapeptide) pyrophosphoryl-undecaprenol N-acetylglucosamine transferase